MANPGALGRAIVGGLAAAFSATALAAPLDCAKLAVSVQPEPPGYAAECLGKPADAAPAASAAPVGSNDGWYVNLRSGGFFGQQLLSASFPFLNYVSHGAQAAPLFATDFDNAATTLWAIDNASRNLGTLNLSTAVFTTVVPVTGIPDDTISGMSFDPTSPSLYVSATTGSPATIANLYTLNMGTGAATLVGPITGYPAITGIAVCNEGQMYAHDVGGDRVLRIDKATGAATEIGATGFNANFAQGMDCDAATNTLWLALYLGGGQQRTARVNLETGTATISGSSSNEELEMAIQNVQPTSAIEPRYIDLNDPAGNGNGVFDPGETVTVHPVWQNIGTNPTASGTGVVTIFTGPPGPTYSLIDPNASYPVTAPGGLHTSIDGYTLSINAATRPAQHWDAGIFENLPHAGDFASWDIHIGGSFDDVDFEGFYYRWIEKAFHRQITAGCGPNVYCPSDPVTREQMAVFVIGSKYPGVTPPACAPPNIFNDVPETSPFCRFIEDLSLRGVVAGCGSGNYCPADPVTREQMSVFILRTLGGQDFNPQGGAQIFSDVPVTNPFYSYINVMYRRGITGGCTAPPNPNYCPSDPVTREQMAVFLVRAFGL